MLLFEVGTWRMYSANLFIRDPIEGVRGTGFWADALVDMLLLQAIQYN